MSWPWIIALLLLQFTTGLPTREQTQLNSPLLVLLLFPAALRASSVFELTLSSARSTQVILLLIRGSNSTPRIGNTLPAVPCSGR